MWSDDWDILRQTTLTIYNVVPSKLHRLQTKKVKIGFQLPQVAMSKQTYIYKLQREVHVDMLIFKTDVI